MKKLIQFDLFLISLTEKFCHYFQVWTGKTNLFLAKVASMSYIVAVFWGLITELQDNQSHFTSIIASNYVQIAFQLGVIFWFYQSEEYDSIRRLSNSVANPLKIRSLFKAIRIFMLAVLVVGNSVTFMRWVERSVLARQFTTYPPLSWDQIEYWILIVWLYLISCDSLPPVSGKIPDWLSKFLARSIGSEAGL